MAMLMKDASGLSKEELVEKAANILEELNPEEDPEVESNRQQIDKMANPRTCRARVQRKLLPPK